MTRHDDASTFADLLARLGDDGSKELFGRLLQEALHELIDAELTAQIGADRYQRSDSRSNGGRSRTLSTPGGDLELRIPKLKVGSFFSAAFPPRPGLAAASRSNAPCFDVLMIEVTVDRSTEHPAPSTQHASSF